jgi:hypothetical protein
MDPASLPKLRNLDMAITGDSQQTPIEFIYRIYGVLASSSRLLETIRIRAWCRRILFPYEGGKLAKLIVQDHGPTIRSIILDEMVLPPQNIASLCHKCPKLRILGFSLPKQVDMVSTTSRYARQ